MKERFIRTANLIKENKFLIPKKRTAFDMKFEHYPYQKGLNQVTKTLNNMSIQFNILYQNTVSTGPDKIEDELGQIRNIFNPEIYNKILNEIKDIQKFVLSELDEQKISLNAKLTLKLQDLKEKNDKELLEKLTKHKSILSSLYNLIEVMEHILKTYDFIMKKINKTITENERIKKEIKFEEEKGKILKHNLKYYLENIRSLEMKMDLMNEKKDEIRKKKVFKNYPQISYMNKSQDPKRNTHYSTISSSGEYGNFNNSYNLLRRTLNSFQNKTFFITKQQKNSTFIDEKDNKVIKKQNENEKNLIKLNNIIYQHIESSKVKIDNANKNYNSIFHIKKKNETELKDYYNDPVYRRIFMDKIFNDANISNLIKKKKIKTIITHQLFN